MITDLITHCAPDIRGGLLVLEEEDVKRNYYDLDTGTMRYWSTNENALVEGQNDPTYPGLRIEELDVKRNGDLWEFAASVMGVKSVKGERRMKDGYQKTEPIGDWDTYEDTWLTTNQNRFRKGNRGQGNFFCVNVRKVQRTALFWKVTGQFAGLDSLRAPTREISCNGQIVSGDSLRINLENGWNDYREGQGSFPKVVVTDTQHSMQAPDTGSVPGARTPLNAPPIRNITWSGDGLRSLWPRGWSLTCAGRQPFGLDVPLWINTTIYEWNPNQVPA